ncbi:MAG: DUF3341 domain-containing protein [Myxococcota bacterium]
MQQNRQMCGVLAQYSCPKTLLRACVHMRQQGYVRLDAHTPFPIHALDKALGLPSSVLPWFVLAAGLLGGVGMLGFMLWVTGSNYPLNIGGKPLWSVPAYVPIVFEMIILSSALTAVFGMFALNKLPRWHHPLFASKAFTAVTNNRFCLLVAATDPQFDAQRVQQQLQQTQALHTEIIWQEQTS